MRMESLHRKRRCSTAGALCDWSCDKCFISNGSARTTQGARKPEMVNTRPAAIDDFDGRPPRMLIMERADHELEGSYCFLSV